MKIYKVDHTDNLPDEIVLAINDKDELMLGYLQYGGNDNVACVSCDYGACGIENVVSFIYMAEIKDHFENNKKPD
jgi:hypothetical protein